MDTNEAAKTLGRLGGLAKSEKKTKAVRKNASIGGLAKSEKKTEAARKNIELAIAKRKSYKLENDALRQRINEMRLCMLDSCGKIRDEEWRKVVVQIAGDEA